MKIAAMLAKARERLATIGHEAPLTDAASRFTKLRANLIVICDDANVMLGVISKTDIVSRMSGCQGYACQEKVAHVMSRDVVYCRPDDRVPDAWALMKAKGILNIPIIDDGRHPIGVLNARDMLQALLGEVMQEDALLRDYIMGIGYH